jgi:Rho GTPase-activating protein RGD1
LKEGADEIDNGLQYHLGRYAFLFESLLHTDGTTLAPLEQDLSQYIFHRLVRDCDDFAVAPGLRAVIEVIDNRGDFKLYMQNYAVAHASSGQKVLRREGPWQEGFVRSLIPPPSLTLIILCVAGCASSASCGRETRPGCIALAEHGCGFAG